MLKIAEHFRCKLFKPSLKKIPSVTELITAWSNKADPHFVGYFNQPLAWNTVYGLAPMEGLSDSHGYSMLPDIRCTYSDGEHRITIGWIEGISMHSGGTVTIRHFALSTRLTRLEIGKIFFEKMIQFFRSMNAVSLVFEETHTSKINHYRVFFKKLGVTEIERGVWKIDLYKSCDIPDHVRAFQATSIK